MSENFKQPELPKAKIARLSAEVDAKFGAGTAESELRTAEKVFTDAARGFTMKDQIAVLEGKLVKRADTPPAAPPAASEPPSAPAAPQVAEPPPAVEPEPTPREQYEALMTSKKFPEAGAFWQAHKEAILSGGKAATPTLGADELQSRLAAEVKAHGETLAKLATAEKDLAVLKTKDTHSSTKAAEQLAAAGITPPQKDTPKAIDALSQDADAIRAHYLDLMDRKEFAAAGDYWKTHAATLETLK